MKTHGEVKVQLHSFLTLELELCELSASRPGRFTPGEICPGTLSIGGWVGHRVGLDARKKRRITCSCREWYPDSSAVQPVAHGYTDWATPARIKGCNRLTKPRNLAQAVTPTDNRIGMFFGSRQKLRCDYVFPGGFIPFKSAISSKYFIFPSTI
jgi:hypothetical protein